jgi:chromosomal replication initiator protein
MFSMSDTVVTKEAVDKVISMIDPGNIPPDILINRIIESVANYFGVTVEAIKSKAKTDAVANARHAAIYIIRKMTDKSYKEVGQIFSRDHSTAMASFYKAETLIKTKKNYDNDIKKIMKEVKGG